MQESSGRKLGSSSLKFGSSGRKFGSSSLKLRSSGRKFGSSSLKFGSSSLKFGEFGPEVREFGPEVREFGPEVRELVPEVRELVPEVEEFGPEVRELSDHLQERIGQLGQYPRRERVQVIIHEICSQERWITSSEIARYLNFQQGNLTRNYLSPMVESGLLERRFPENVTHPQQAYRSVTSQLTLPLT